MKYIVCTLYFQTENAFASFEMNFILRNANITAVNIIMYIPTRHGFVNNTDTPDQRDIYTRTRSNRGQTVSSNKSTFRREIKSYMIQHVNSIVV